MTYKYIFETHAHESSYEREHELCSSIVFGRSKYWFDRKARIHFSNCMRMALLSFVDRRQTVQLVYSVSLLERAMAHGPDALTMAASNASSRSV